MADPALYRPENVPDEPGVYRFFNEKDEVIYVGKARSLKNRISSYFQKNVGEKTYRMIHAANRVDWTLVRSEVEALQLEFTWIKEENPAFNVQFKDDKSYPYLALTMDEKYPRLLITRRAKQKGVAYFGPFTHAWALRSTFDVLLKLFPVRSCSNSNFERAQRAKRPCLLGDIGKCAAPCVDRITESDHRVLAKRLGDFISDGSADITQALRDQMSEAARAEEFERAGKLRDQLDALERASESTDSALSDSIFSDFIAIHQDITHAAISIFRVRAGRVISSRSWMIDLANLPEQSSLLEACINRVYQDFEIGKEILVNQDIEGSALAEYLSERAGYKVSIKKPERGEKSEILDMVKRNANQALIQFLGKRANDAGVSGRALEDLASALNLEELPLRIECFDISNIQGTSVVASMVVFEDGQAKKSEYRRFGIDDKEKFDDTRAMHHVITRRFKRYLAEKDLDLAEIELSGGARPKFAYPPQLVIVDGGKGQVNAAARAFAELGITDIALVGLAKRLEEIWFADQSYPVVLDRHSEALYLVQRIRDEAHRFAVTFHRSKRSKLMLESLLDEISNLGEVRRAVLLENFGSIAALSKASLEEIAALPGIGPKSAESIVAGLANSASGYFVDTSTGEIIERS
ncbi:MAG: excinuclease ABC subunit C [Actinobacteria bacterium BACL2 MAG-121001-bin67]|mgnify:FL=1|jgi:excinuclease ABC subunit C|uniref:UvrABC system protein C n=3 Tax=ac1 cluster TaxID=1655545 RepID=A0A0R2PAQ2_9ACTN|nr:MAG: excinuclease ABC subunit C [Actinobacteria bacterium BACL2 MAG-120802-bin41]KRO33091.1 MAG: excinuclease ABC subunit C [Actinobacteria bacterium BACL2 MAG-121001-bin67]KRO45372.1 MAG: excinuclease ABC subunit C [Actinobacteria bacterium BACL2 MAG-120813-bin23]KRP31101.1 MAG: excinuclease ABC subunit C [Actinobacteria bacterium BACL2 MAG-120507-bin38]MDP4615039.1 excinuclease ABC subunit UvrC [Candidatus Nanopelagicales bacterium]MDP4931697.1 excinuclease ABC subunit UvrC [Candidatus Na